MLRMRARCVEGNEGWCSQASASCMTGRQVGDMHLHLPLGCMKIGLAGCTWCTNYLMHVMAWVRWRAEFEGAVGSLAAAAAAAPPHAVSRAESTTSASVSLVLGTMLSSSMQGVASVVLPGAVLLSCHL